MSSNRAATRLPLVSLVIPCFRSERFLARSMGSVLARDSRAAVRAFIGSAAGPSSLAAASGLLDELSRFLDSRPDLPMVAFRAGSVGQVAMGRQPLLTSIGAASPDAFFDPVSASPEAAACKAGGHALIIS
jgi:hypothetical protein